jgi:hypothetical protein
MNRDRAVTRAFEVVEKLDTNLADLNALGLLRLVSEIADALQEAYDHGTSATLALTTTPAEAITQIPMPLRKQPVKATWKDAMETDKTQVL